MKNSFIFLLIIFVILIGNNFAHAQFYGNRTLQQELDLDRAISAKQLADKQQAQDLKNMLTLAEVGLPLTIGISIGVFLYMRK